MNKLFEHRCEEEQQIVEDLIEALDRQCDNMAFVLNHMSVPGQWNDKFTEELEADRKILKKGEKK